MPLYEYQCQACGKVQEVRQKIADPAPSACKVCNQGPMVKMLSQTSFILKGGGWYVTDFRGGSSKPAEAASSASPASTDSGSSSKPDAAPVAPSKASESSSKD